MGGKTVGFPRTDTGFTHAAHILRPHVAGALVAGLLSEHEGTEHNLADMDRLAAWAIQRRFAENHGRKEELFRYAELLSKKDGAADSDYHKFVCFLRGFSDDAPALLRAWKRLHGYTA